MPTIRNLEIDGVTYDIPKEVYFVTDEGYSQYTPFIFAGKKAGIYVFNLALTEATDHYFSYLSGSGVRGQPTRFHPDIVIIPQDVPADESDMSDDDLLGYAFNLVTSLVSGNFIQSAIKFVFKTYKTNRVETSSVIYIEKQLVDLVSEQSISAKKSFLVLPESSTVPTTDNQLVNKKYADSLNYYLGKNSQYATSANAFNLTNLEPGSYYFMKDSNDKLNLKLVHNSTTSTVELSQYASSPINDLIVLSIFIKPVNCPNNGTTIFGSVSWTSFPNEFNLNRTIYDLTVSNDNNIVATYRQIALAHPALLSYANYFSGENTFANKLRALLDPVNDNEVVNKGYLFSLLTDRELAGSAHIENASSSGTTSTVIGNDYILNTAHVEEPDEGFTVTLVNTSGDTKSNVAVLLYESEERTLLIDKILITELEPFAEYPTEVEFLSDDMYVDVFENYVEEIDLNTKTINNVSLKGSGNLTTSDLGINEIKRITSNKNIWELSAGVYIVSGNLNLYYSSSKYFTTCSTGIILCVTGISSGKVSFYAMGRGVESSKSSENSIVVGVAQNNAYGVCDSYNIHNLSVTVTTVNNQTIDGVKTFSNLPESPATPTTDNQLVNKSYVDNTISDEVDSLNDNIRLYSGYRHPLVGSEFTCNLPTNIGDRTTKDLSMFTVYIDKIDDGVFDVTLANTDPFSYGSSIYGAFMLIAKNKMDSDNTFTGKNLLGTAYSDEIPAQGTMTRRINLSSGTKVYVTLYENYIIGLNDIVSEVARTGDYNDLTNKPITYSTTDINPGDALESGSLYIVYE